MSGGYLTDEQVRGPFEAPTVDSSELLTRDEVSELAEGTHVEITWSGGNGPHTYVIAVDKYGRRYAAINEDPDDPFRWYNPITFVGSERCHTHVTLLSGA